MWLIGISYPIRIKEIFIDLLVNGICNRESKLGNIATKSHGLSYIFFVHSNLLFCFISSRQIREKILFPISQGEIFQTAKYNCKHYFTYNHNYIPFLLQLQFLRIIFY